MEQALARKDWPEVCDRTTTDNYPSEEETDQKDQVGHGHVKFSVDASRALVQAGTSRVSKRALGEDSNPTVPTKRSKITVV